MEALEGCCRLVGGRARCTWLIIAPAVVCSVSSSAPLLSSSLSDFSCFVPALIMHRLADVEIRLIMQTADAHSLLRLGRCSRQMLHVADRRITWTHAAVTLASAAFAVSPSQLSTPLMRHAPAVTLAISASKPLRGFTVVDMLTALARAHIDLVEFDASAGHRLSAYHWRKLLAHSACNHLRVLRMSYAHPMDLDNAFWAAFAALAELHTATIAPSAPVADGPVWDTPQLRLMAHQMAPVPAPVWQLGSHLTSLGFGGKTVDFRPLHSIRLQRLELRNILLMQDAQAYFTSEAAQNLHCVAIVGYVIAAFPLSVILCGPSQLHTLELIDSWQASEWLPELHHARALRLLRIVFVGIPQLIDARWSEQALAQGAAVELLEQLPQLHLEMSIRVQATPTGDKATLADMPTLQAYAAPIQAAFPSRFTMHIQ